MEYDNGIWYIQLYKLVTDNYINYHTFKKWMWITFIIWKAWHTIDIKNNIIITLNYFRCIIEFLSENRNGNDSLDRSFSPPAPLMTMFEQKLIALLIDLEVSKPMIIHFVQAGIQYKLFKLNNDIKVCFFLLLYSYLFII